ncbi:MAG: M23 family metallopeptidase [Candidatus Vogelbacteria bacterium]
MRNYVFCLLFSSVSLWSVSEVVAQPVATDFQTPVWPVDQSKNGYNNNANPFLALNKGAYHMGEDWNGNEGGSKDFGKPVYPMAVGKVVKVLNPTQKGSVGKVVVVKHLLPDGQVIYSYYFHLSKILVVVNQIVSPGKPLGQIGDANGYYKNAAHLHFEVRRVNQTLSSSYAPTLLIATEQKYLDPSLFIDDRKNQIDISTSGANTIIITVSSGDLPIPDYAPASLAYVTKGNRTLSLSSAIMAGWLDSTAYTRIEGDSQWESVELNEMVFGPDVDFWINFLTSCTLTIVVPGHNFQASRARDDMIHTAQDAGLTRVKMETLTYLGNDWTGEYDLRSLCFDKGSNTNVSCLVQATGHDNPLLRYVIWYDPWTETGIGDWIEIDQNDIN